VQFTADRAFARHRAALAARVTLAVPPTDRAWVFRTVPVNRIARAQRPMHRCGVDTEDLGDGPHDLCARESDWTTAPRSARGTVSRRSLSWSSTYSSLIA
jgi:hypothetical protein